MGWNYDPDGIHAHQSGEINALTEKTTPHADDLLLGEDSENSGAKVGIKVGNLGGGAEVLDDLTDVDTTGVADGDVLVYDADTSTWVPGEASNASYSEKVGDTSETTFNIAHSLDSSAVAVEIIEVSTGDALVAGTDYTWSVTDADNIEVVFGTAPGADDALVVVLASGGTSGGGGGGGTSNHFLFKTYTLSPSPTSPYVDNEDDADASTTASTAYAAVAGYMLTNGDRGDPSSFTTRFVGFNVTTGTVAIRIDAGTAVGGDLLRAWGMFGSDLIGRPTGIKVEHSDDDSSWTTVEDRTGLTGSASGGRRFWRLDVDTSTAGSHRYWRVTTTGFSAWTFISEVELWQLS